MGEIKKWKKYSENLKRKREICFKMHVNWRMGSVEVGDIIVSVCGHLLQK